MYILEDLWLGKIDPSGRTVEKGSPYAKLLRQVRESSETFFQELSEAGKAAYEAHYNTLSEAAMLSEYDNFINGFRMGARMMLDVLGEDGPAAKEQRERWVVE